MAGDFQRLINEHNVEEPHINVVGTFRMPVLHVRIIKRKAISIAEVRAAVNKMKAGNGPSAEYIYSGVFKER